MFVVTLTYTAPIERIDELVAEHRAWLDQQYAAGVLLASGPQLPRVGGILLARAADRAALEQVLTGDPFRLAGVATYDVVEFDPIKTAP
jgi:uncharacterized protein YciI